MGTSEYEELTPIPAAANSLDRMHRLLTGSLCVWPEERVTVLPNERVPGELADRLVELYLAATDVALFYYVGHGQIDDDDRLCLGLVGSRLQAERRATTSLTFDAVRAALRRSRARVKIVILDCCFAGHAVHGPHTLAGAVDVPALASGTGAYTLAATGDYTTAWFEDDRDTPTPLTYFTKYLVDIVEQGIAGEPTALTLDPIYWRLREDLPAAGKPVPGRTSRDFADTFVFARNAASIPTEPASAPDAGGYQEVTPDSPSTLPSREEESPVLAAPVELVTAPAPEPSTPTVAPTPETGPPVPGPSPPLMAPSAPARNGPVSAVEPSPAVSLVRWMLLPQRSSRSALAGVAALLILLIVTAAVTIAARVHSSSAIILSSTSEVDGVAFSPDSKILASGSGDNTVRLWNPATGQQIGQPLTGHTKDVHSVAFSSDGKFLASGGSDYTVRLWNPATGQPIGQLLTGGLEGVSSVVFSRSGILAGGSWDNTVLLWNPADGSLRATLTGHTTSVNSVAFSPDGKTLASGSGSPGSSDNTVRLWNPATGQPIDWPCFAGTGELGHLICG